VFAPRLWRHPSRPRRPAHPARPAHRAPPHPGPRRALRPAHRNRRPLSRHRPHPQLRGQIPPKPCIKDLPMSGVLDLRGRYRRRDRPRPGEVQADRPRRPPGCRPGLSPLTRLTRSCPRSRPTSPGRSTSVPVAGTAPALAPSNAGATTPTASRNPPTTASATMRRQPSGSPIR